MISNRLITSLSYTWSFTFILLYMYGSTGEQFDRSAPHCIEIESNYLLDSIHCLNRLTSLLHINLIFHPFFLKFVYIFYSSSVSISLPLSLNLLRNDSKQFTRIVCDRELIMHTCLFIYCSFFFAIFTVAFFLFKSVFLSKWRRIVRSTREKNGASVVVVIVVVVVLSKQSMTVELFRNSCCVFYLQRAQLVIARSKAKKKAKNTG